MWYRVIALYKIWFEDSSGKKNTFKINLVVADFPVLAFKKMVIYWSILRICYIKNNFMSWKLNWGNKFATKILKMLAESCSLKEYHSLEKHFDCLIDFWDSQVLFSVKAWRYLIMTRLSQGVTTTKVWRRIQERISQAVPQRCSVKKVFLEISQNSQENGSEVEVELHLF